MAKPKTTYGDRDYGRRLYVSNMPFTEQVRKWSDAFRDRTAKQPHSEDKKPYVEDVDYPEMEYFNTPWDPPHFPDLPTMPDDPTINNLPDVDGGGYSERDPTPRDNRFLGCNFYQGFTPSELLPGQTASAKLQRLDDPVIGFTIHGPGTIISGGNALCTAAGQELFRQQGTARPGAGSSPECTVIIKAWASGWEQFAPQGSGGIPIVVIAHTESGRSCSTELTLKTCPSEIPLEWDAAVSPVSLAPGNNAVVAVKGGTGPYTWSVSGTNVTIDYSRTKTTILRAAAGFCGTAQITVTDACDEVVTGGVMSTSGSSWYRVDPYSCIGGGPFTSIEWREGWNVFIRNVGGKKCEDYVNPYYGGATDCGFCASVCANASPDACDPASPCTWCMTGILDYLQGGQYWKETDLCMGYQHNPDRYICYCNKGAICYQWECNH